jgi:mono/diheme cytochrome c family protein
MRGTNIEDVALQEAATQPDGDLVAESPQLHSAEPRPRHGLSALTRPALAAGFICVLGVAGWAYHSTTFNEDDGFLQWRDPQVTAAGRMLYGAHCAACHGVLDGTSTPEIAASEKPAPRHDETGHSWQHPDFALFRLVFDGVAEANCLPVDPALMPRFKGTVSDSELVAILSYIKSTWPDDIRDSHDQVNMIYRAYNKAVEDLIEVHPGNPL